MTGVHGPGSPSPIPILLICLPVRLNPFLHLSLRLQMFVSLLPCHSLPARNTLDRGQQHLLAKVLDTPLVPFVYRGFYRLINNSGRHLRRILQKEFGHALADRRFGTCCMLKRSCIVDRHHGMCILRNTLDVGRLWMFLSRLAHRLANYGGFPIRAPAPSACLGLGFGTVP